MSVLKRYALATIGVAGVLVAIGLLNRSVGLSVVGRAGLVLASGTAAGLALGWYQLLPDTGEQGRVFESRRGTLAFSALFWLSFVVVTVAVTPAPAERLPIGPLAIPAGLVFVALVFVSMRRNGIREEFSPSHIRRQFENGRREAIDREE